MAALEQLVLDGLVLNDTTNWRLQGLECPPPKKRFEWAQGGDADGAALVRDPLFDNREVTLRLRVNQRATMDLALTAIGALVDKLEEADKQSGGLDLIWTPAESTKSFTFKVLSGEITGLPISMDGEDAGWFKRSPVVTVVLTCKPFAYGTEVIGSGTSSATPIVTLTVASVTGDVPAEGRLIVTDAATQNRRYMEWGLENRFYNAGTSLLLDSDSMTTTGTGGVGATRTNAYDPGAAGNSVIRGTLQTSWMPVAATGNQSHVGTFRVKARVQGVGTGPINVRFAWQEGNGPYRANPLVVLHLLGGWAEIDLGIITIPEKILGTQRWQGRVEATSETEADTLDVDYLVFVPAGEGYGKSRTGNVSLGVSSFTAYDTFQTIGTGVALNARVAPAGGTWATSGVATDFVGVNWAGGADQMVWRTTTTDTTGPRFAILGATTFTDTVAEVQLIHVHPTAGVFDPGSDARVIVRWVDANNYIALQFVTIPHGSSGATTALCILQVLAGVQTLLASTEYWLQQDVFWHLRVYAFATGQVIGEVRQTYDSNPVLKTLTATSTAVATGGALQSGKPGFADRGATTGVVNRYYNQFKAGTPLTEQVVINSGRILEVRSDSVLQADSTGTYYGPPPSYQGSRFWIPQAGDEARTTRVLVKAHRQDIEASDALNVTDNLTAQVNYTPRYLVVPR